MALPVVHATIRPVGIAKSYRFSTACGIAGAMLASGCALTTRAPPAEDTLPVITTATDTTNRVASAQRIALLNTPRRMKEDYVYPQPYTRQDFSWTGSFAEWRIRFTPQRYGYAGVVFTKAYDLSAFAQNGTLQFRMKPANMARYLSVGFVDGSSREPRVLADLALDEDGGTDSADWAVIRIALSAFPRKGLAIEDRDPSETFAFDWSDVEEIRFITEGRNMPNQEVTIAQILVTR